LFLKGFWRIAFIDFVEMHNEIVDEKIRTPVSLEVVDRSVRSERIDDGMHSERRCDHEKREFVTFFSVLPFIHSWPVLFELGTVLSSGCSCGRAGSVGTV
jgi:hypothetical protein